MMSEEDTFRILLSTDNHLGFLEKDPIRGNDSFVTFEEVLSISKKQHPDFILLGGDLFHENKPSISSIFKCMGLIRQYSFNNNPINFQIVSDQSVNFSQSEKFPLANFNDENFNVGMPIFTIHGNHDDPVEQSNLCALDLFHESGLVNLFGKTPTVEAIVIQPILLRKGSTQLALYGLGAIRNERLHRLFQQKKVTFLRPSEDTEDWFSIFVIHQNRVKHGATNYIPESFLPTFIDLVVWGHEHDCRIDPEYNTSQEFYVTQPGSSVATSLSEGESVDKFVGLLEIRGKDFKIEKTKLQTVRPFAIGEIVLADEKSLCVTDTNVSRKIEELCHEKVRDLLVDTEALCSGHPDQPTLPLVRLKVDYSGGYDMFSTMRFSQHYVDKVANTKDLLLLHRKRELTARQATSAIVSVVLDVRNVRNDSGLDAARVEDLVKQHFVKTGDKLQLLNERKLGVCVRRSVEKDDREFVCKLVELDLDRVQKHLRNKRVPEDLLVDEIELVVGEAARRDEEEQAAQVDLDGDGEGEGDGRDGGLIMEVMASTQQASYVSSLGYYKVESVDGGDNGEQDKKPSKRGGRGRGRGGRGRGIATTKDDMFSVNSNVSMKSMANDDSSSDFGSIADSFRKRKLKSDDSESSKSRRT